MKRLTILLGVFLSIFILVLIPSINCVNANIQNENNLELKNIDIDDIKTIRNRLKDSDCNCQKTANNINSKSQEPKLLCRAIEILIFIILDFANKAYEYNPRLVFLFSFIFDIPLDFLFIFGEKILHCDWYYLPTFNKVFTNNEQFLYNFIKFSYLGLGDIYEK